MNKGLRIEFNDLRANEPKQMVFHYEGGLREYVAYLNENKSPITKEIIDCEGIEENIQVEIAMQYNDGFTSNIYSFCNNINTQEGGTHEEGFRNALTRVINNYAKENGFIKKMRTPCRGRCSGRINSDHIGETPGSSV